VSWMEISTCPDCGVPSYVTSEHVWLSDGLIAQRRNQRHVVSFIESDNLDPLFQGIEQIIGIPIDQIILTARRRAARAYMGSMIPAEVRELLQKKEMDPGPVIEMIISVGKVLGYGRFEWVDYRYELDDEDYAVVRVENPYSVSFGLVDPLAVLEVITGYEASFEFKQDSKGFYEIRVFRSSHSPALKERLIMRTYTHREDDIVLDRCATCGAPLELSSYIWDLDGGTIRGRETGRRMAILAPTVLDVVLGELERELGKAIPEVVVESQRRFTRSGIYAFDETRDEGKLRTQLALRGLGNLKSFDMGKKGLHLHLDNAVMHLIMVGLIQGTYELAYGVESMVKWEFSEEGNLEVQVTPWS
jgi:hypothetical protein